MTNRIPAIVTLVLLVSFTACSKETARKTHTDVFTDLRAKAFSVSQSDLQITLAEGKSVYGVIMETGYADEVVSMVALGDGSVSLYFSNGAGIIGMGEHEMPRKTCMEYISMADGFTGYAQKTTKTELPANGETIFYFLTTDGLKFYKEQEELLGNNQSPLSQLFYRANELINEARSVYEAKRKKQ